MYHKRRVFEDGNSMQTSTDFYYYAGVTDTKCNSSVAAEAKELCEKYVNTDQVALDVILIPGEINFGVEKLSSKIKLYEVDDCVYGLSATRDFIKRFIVESSSRPLDMNGSTQDYLPSQFVKKYPTEINVLQTMKKSENDFREK